VRIGLAFRLALSQVLPTYQGNELDTLIIDEGGFGALDEEGQDGVIDVFSAIQDRFQRMIIISHIDSIAENLPGTSLHIEDGRVVHEES
jgi:exonuclease SbcC